MASPAKTEHEYYKLLEASPTATTEDIIKAYKRLALNRSIDDFLLLTDALDTLTATRKRRDYDRIYPIIRQRNSDPHAQIAEIRKNRDRRLAQWRILEHMFATSKSELVRSIAWLEGEIEDLIDAVAVLEDLPCQSEDQKTLQEAGKQQRINKKISKDRQLALQRAELQGKERVFEQTRVDFFHRNGGDEQEIRAIQDRLRKEKARSRKAQEVDERQPLDEKSSASVQEQEEIRIPHVKVTSTRNESEARAARKARQKEKKKDKKKEKDTEEKKSQANSVNDASKRPGNDAHNRHVDTGSKQ